MTKILTFIILTLGMNSFGFTQNNDSTIIVIDNYVTAIDSNKNLAEGISEGEIEDNGEIIGGAETYDLYDRETKELFRIQDNIATDTIIGKTFYYKDKELVYAYIEFGVWKNNKYEHQFDQRIYYSNNQTFYNSMHNGKGYDPETIHKEGIKYQQAHIEYYKRK